MTTDSHHVDASDDELSTLRKRVTDLELHGAELALSAATATGERARLEQELAVSNARFEAIAGNAPVGIYQTNPLGECTFINDRCCALIGLTQAEALGTGWARTLHPEDRTMVFSAWVTTTHAGEEFYMEYRLALPSGTINWVSATATPLRDQSGEIAGYFGVLVDITARRKIEDVLRESLRQQDLIMAQRAALQELSTPLIPLSDQIMVMPLIGVVDSARAAQVLETLLAGIAKSRASFAILDITGVATVDTQVANALLRSAKAVRLLGAQMVLCGIRAEVAQTLVTLGADLEGIVTCGTLQSGIAHAMRAARGEPGLRSK